MHGKCGQMSNRIESFDTWKTSKTPIVLWNIVSVLYFVLASSVVSISAARNRSKVWSFLRIEIRMINSGNMI